MSQIIRILSTKFRAYFSTTEERGIADDDVYGGPFWLGGCAVGIIGENRVAVFDLVKAGEDWLGKVVEAIGDPPLQIADPNDDLSQLKPKYENFKNQIIRGAVSNK